MGSMKKPNDINSKENQLYGYHLSHQVWPDMKNVRFDMSANNYHHFEFPKSSTLKILKTDEDIKVFMKTGGRFKSQVENHKFNLSESGECSVEKHESHLQYLEYSEYFGNKYTHAISPDTLDKFILKDQPQPSPEECLKYYKMYSSKDSGSKQLAKQIISFLHYDFNWLKQLTGCQLYRNGISLINIMSSALDQIITQGQKEHIHSYSLVLEYLLQKTYNVDVLVEEDPFKIVFT